ncbi:MAG: hypothetical protein JST37_15870 [Bacteroidetes bacterium]|nr:hypothetical protein [Bacteroidota bacterium]MBS1980995.1 hypothetical protein [Bacteroidota bacterium]
MEINKEFVLTWDHYMELGAVICVVIAILILLYHEYRVMQIKDYKEKYDYVNLNEIRYFWFAMIAVIVALGFVANSFATGKIITHGMLWFYVRIFITACFIVIGYVAFYSMVRIYYPHYVEKRLIKLRNKPRISPAGNEMRKLSEEEEDAHLDAQQIAEEASSIHSIDYDVWIDEKTGYKKIEKYESYLHAEQCPNCGFYTFKITREEVAEKPTDHSGGLLVKHYRCDYCNHREARETKLSALSKNVA